MTNSTYHSSSSSVWSDIGYAIIGTIVAITVGWMMYEALCFFGKNRCWCNGCDLPYTDIEQPLIKSSRISYKNINRVPAYHPRMQKVLVTRYAGDGSYLYQKVISKPVPVCFWYYCK
ncbi:hypothetical protein CL622_04225 [archaeon]|nr:hypothetical protein [archaeon]